VANVHFVAGEMTKKQNKWVVGEEGVEGELFMVAHTQVIRIEERIRLIVLLITKTVHRGEQSWFRRKWSILRVTKGVQKL